MPAGTVPVSVSSLLPVPMTTLVFSRALPPTVAVALVVKSSPVMVSVPPPYEAPLVVVSYALNGSSTFTRIGSGDLTIPATWVTANTPAGIIASHQQGGAPFVATFASFSVSRLNG